MDPHSEADTRSEEIHKRTAHPDGWRYGVRMLWAEDPPKLPNNSYSATAQLLSLEKRSSRDPDLEGRYAETVSQDIEKGYVVEIAKGVPSLTQGKE